jgi:hypothetical protein
MRPRPAFLRTLVLPFTLLACIAAPAPAAPIIKNFTVKGSFSSGGLNNAAFNAAPGNILVGQSSQETHRNYFVFDLTGVTDNVTTAQLVVNSPFGSYISPDLTETWTIFDYTSAIAILQNQNSSSVGAYNDLGSGNAYGSAIVSEASEGIPNGPTFPVVIDLNATAIADINAARGGNFALGGALTTINGPDSQLFFAFSSNDEPAQLILNPIPEPGPVLLLSVLSALPLARRRRPRRAGAK